MTTESDARLRELALAAIAAWDSANEPGLSTDVELERLRDRNAALMAYEIVASPQVTLALLDAKAAAERDLARAREQWRLTLEMAEDMLGYVPDYFKTKYHYDDEVTAMRAALGESSDGAEEA